MYLWIDGVSELEKSGFGIASVFENLKNSNFEEELG